MIEKRSSSIHNKAIKPTDIVQLAKVFSTIYEELLSKHNKDVKNKIISEYASKPRVSFHLESDDGIEYSTDNLELFQQDGVIYNRVFTELGFRVDYFELSYEARMSLSCNKYSSSYFEVEGSDSNWVASTFQKLRDCVSLWEHQDSKIKRYRWPLSIALSVMVGWFLGTIVFFILNYYIHDLKPSIFYVCTITGSWFLGSILSWPLADHFAGLWPDIEIVPGPEHRRILQMKRHRLTWLFSVIIIPFLISLIVALIIQS